MQANGVIKWNTLWHRGACESGKKQKRLVRAVAEQTLLVQTTPKWSCTQPAEKRGVGFREPLGRLVLWRTSCTVTLMHQSAAAHCCQPQNPRVWKRISHHNAPVTARIRELKREGKALPKKSEISERCKKKPTIKVAYVTAVLWIT